MNTIKIYFENGVWHALIGPNPDEGIVGKSDSPVRALRELVFSLQIKDWYFTKKPLNNYELIEKERNHG